jgi:acetyltransferase-like isoleucine patch superfamily enzyme
MTELLENKRKVTFKQKFKTWMLKRKYGKQLKTNGPIRILGNLPVLKLPGNSSIVLGEKVVLNSDAKNSNTALTFNCTLACGLNGVIEIGDNTMLNGVSVTAYQRVSIGKNCQIASCTLISDTDFHPVNPETRMREVLGHKFDHKNVNKAEVTIGDNVWIGWGSIILKGVTIGENSVIAAGSVVLKDIPPNVIAGGNPAVVKRELAS